VPEDESVLPGKAYAGEAKPVTSTRVTAATSRTGAELTLRKSTRDAGTALVRAEGRDERVVGFERAVVSFFVDAAEMLGVPRSIASIYAICFASPHPLGFTEIDEALNISSGSISQGLKVLREVGALKVVVAPLEKRERFEPDLELRKLITNFIAERLQKQLSAGDAELGAMKAAIPPGGSDGSVAKLMLRIDALQAWHQKGQALLPIMQMFLSVT
jgi:HTH-type transcriptional regulator, glycine betaine synthesis regulator